MVEPSRVCERTQPRDREVGMKVVVEAELASRFAREAEPLMDALFGGLSG
jgi:hypothetical protein